MAGQSLLGRLGRPFQRICLPISRRWLADAATKGRGRGRTARSAAWANRKRARLAEVSTAVPPNVSTRTAPRPASTALESKSRRDGGVKVGAGTRESNKPPRRPGQSPGTTSESHCGKHVKLVSPRANAASLAKRLSSGHPAAIAPGHRYGDAVKLYAKVKNRLGERDAIANFDDHRAYNARVRDALQWLLLPVAADPAGPRLDLTAVAAPEVPADWLEAVARDRPFIPIRAWFGLQSAARWRKQGVHYTGLDHPIYPFPGCYFAVPTSRWVCFHFDVFNQWLVSGGMTGVRAAAEVGTGCGVLSFMMLRHAEPTARLLAVDINPAAVLTVAETAKALGHRGAAITVERSNLLPPAVEAAADLDLVVFNPPWFPATPADQAGATVSAAINMSGHAGPYGTAAAAEGNYGNDNDNSLEWLAGGSDYLRAVSDGGHWLEAASYRDPRLMTDFFDSAHAALRPGGRVAVVYCNYARLVGRECDAGPVPAELAGSGRFRLAELRREPVPLGKRARNGGERGWKTELLRKLEIELWILEKC